MHLGRVLSESFKLLYRKPKVFIPRLITASLYTLIQLLTLKLIVDLNTSMIFYVNPTPPPNPSSIYDFIVLIPVGSNAEMESLYISSISLLILTSLTPLIDLFVHAMYPKITLDYHRGKRINLYAAFREALSKWFFLLVYLTVTLIIAAGLVLMVSVSSIISLLLRCDLFIYIAVILAAVTVLALGTLLFLAIPIAVIDRESTLNSFRKSFTMGLEHRRDILSLLIMYSVLMGAAILLVSLTQFTELDGYITLTAVSTYLLARLIQAVVKTYISVVNPYFYLHRKYDENINL